MVTGRRSKGESRTCSTDPHPLVCAIELIQLPTTTRPNRTRPTCIQEQDARHFPVWGVRKCLGVCEQCRSCLDAIVQRFTAMQHCSELDAFGFQRLRACLSQPGADEWSFHPPSILCSSGRNFEDVDRVVEALIKKRECP